jgi:hypothetical protein
MPSKRVENDNQKKKKEIKSVIKVPYTTVVGLLVCLILSASPQLQ